MKRLNKVIALFLVVLLAFSSVGVTAFAEGDNPDMPTNDSTPLSTEDDSPASRVNNIFENIRQLIKAIIDFIKGLFGLINPVFAVDSVSIEGDLLVLQVGDIETIIPTISPENATNKDVVWSSSDESVATVDDNGAVLGISGGIATITVTTVDGNKTATLDVLVGNLTVPTDSSLQAAIDAADPEQVIAVAPGIIHENIIIDKPLTLLGPNAGIAGYEDRASEAVITYPENTDTTDLSLVNVTADGVIINGFSFINEQETADVSAKELLFTGENYEFINNRVISYADKVTLHFGILDQEPNAQGDVVVKNNYIESTSSWAALYLQGRGGNVEDNVIVGGIMAIQIQPYANTVGGIVKNNVLSGYDNGIWHNFAKKGSATWTYEGNTITAHEPTNWYRWSDRYWRGFTVQTYGTVGTGDDPHVIFINNTIDGANATVGDTWDEVIGIHFKAGASNTATYEFTGNTIQNVSLGVFRASGQADLTQILQDNTFPESSQVIDNKILVPTWEMLADTSWYDDPSSASFTIDASAELAGLAELVNDGTSFNGKIINLAADLDLGNLEWTPIGDASKWFGGIFNGNGYKVSGLKITDNTRSAIGLFGYVRGAGDSAGIRNLVISGKIDIKDANVFSPNLGLVAGLVWGFVENCVTTDEKTDNSIVYKSIYSLSGQHRPAVGGLVGWNANSNYPHNGTTGGSFTGTILVETEVEYSPGVAANSGPYVGGLVGMANRVNVANGNVDADITVNAYRYISLGGIIGYAMGEKMDFSNLTYMGDLKGYTAMLGESYYSTCYVEMGGIIGSGEFAGASGESGVVNATVSGSLTADIDGPGASIFTGGIIGEVFPYWREPCLENFEIADCDIDLQHNIILDSEASVYTGGLTGLVYNDATVKSTIDFRNSTVAGEISVTNTVATTTEEAFVGGLLGYGYKYNSDSALNPQFFITNCTAVTPTVSLDYPTLGTGDNWGRNDWVVASIGNVYYESLEVAIAALQDGDTLTILTDEFILDKKILFKKNDITIQGQTDVNGNPITTIKGAGNSVEQFRIEGYNVTVRDLIFDNIADGGTARESQGVYFYYPNNVWQADRVNKLINCVSYNTYWAIFSGVKMSFEMEGCTFQKTDTTSSVFMDRPYEVTIIDSSFLGQEGYALHIDNGVVGGIFDAKDCIFTGGVVTAGASENNTGVGNAVYTFTDCGFYTSSGVNGGWYASYYSSGSKFENCSFDADFDGAGTGQYSYLGSYVYLDPDCTKEGSSLDLTIFYNVGDNVISGVNVLLNSEDKIIGGIFASDPTANLADGYVANESSGIWIVSQE